MIRLAARLTAGSGRESLIRLLLTGAGMALAVTMLLFAAVAFPALHAHDARRGWIETSADNGQPAQDESTTDPLLWRLTEDRFDGRDLVRVDVAPEGPDAPVPPGLRRLPGPGEIAVSPELRELMETTEPAMLADRFPGRVSAIVGRDALMSPDDLVVFVGRAPDDLRSEDHITVRSIESAPVSRDLTRFMRVVLVVGGAGLLVPVVVFVATATRLAAARREQRLAALRLAGATSGQVGAVAAVEAAIAAIGGVVVGFVAFLLLRPWVAGIPFDGATFYPSDLRLSPLWAVIVGVGVPALAVGAAMVSLRRIRISPPGVARRAPRSRPRPWALLLVAAGVVGMALVVLWAQDNTAANEATVTSLLCGTFVVVILGIVLSGPWLTSMVARGIARFSRRAPSLLAARRLQDNPAAGFRAISGLVVAVFVGTVFSGLAASILAMDGIGDNGLAPDVVMAAPDPEAPEASPAEGDGGGEPSAVPADETAHLPRRPALEPERATELVDDLGATPGVQRVVVGHAVPDDVLASLSRSGAHIFGPVLLRCTDAAALGMGRCEGTTVVNMTSYDVERTRFAAAVAVDELASYPVETVAAVTDGSVAAIERARTLLAGGVAGAQAVTRRDIDAEGRRELDTLQRISDVGLAGTLIIAGCSLAVAVAGAIVERKQPFALLRLSGVRLSDLRRVVMAEAATPMLMVAAANVGLGLVVAALLLATGSSGDDNAPSFVLPGPSYWLALAGGLAVALLVVLATLPLLSRLTSLDTARFE